MEKTIEKKVKFFDKVKKNEYYLKWIKSPLTYVAAAILLSVFQIVTLASTGNPWGVSGVFAYWGAWLYEAVGGSVDKWYYFASSGAQSTMDAGFLSHAGTWRNLGIIFGALATTLLASGFKIKKPPLRAAFFVLARMLSQAQPLRRQLLICSLRRWLHPSQLAPSIFRLRFRPVLWLPSNPCL